MLLINVRVYRELCETYDEEVIEGGSGYVCKDCGEGYGFTEIYRLDSRKRI